MSCKYYHGDFVPTESVQIGSQGTLCSVSVSKVSQRIWTHLHYVHVHVYLHSHGVLKLVSSPADLGQVLPLHSMHVGLVGVAWDGQLYYSNSELG